MKFFMFHLMPWPYLPADFEERHTSAWVTCPNTYYDATRGTAVYNNYLDELQSAEALGFDGVCINEHHQNAYGTMPSPNLIAACLARTTKRLKLAVVGNALPLYDHPIRVAEEIAMLDVITGGRMISGQVIGHGPEYYSYGVNPTYARERFREAHELILKAWTDDGPFAWEGKHYNFRYVNLWPKPLQKPHPPIWIPGIGSLETMEYVAKKHFCYFALPYFHFDVYRRNFEQFRECCRKEGYEADPEQAGYLIPIHVAETDEKAREEYQPHLWYFMKKLLLLPPQLGFPPGYITPRSYQNVVGSFTRKNYMGTQNTWEDLMEGRFILAGSPATVREQLTYILKELGTGVMLCLFQIGSMPHDLALKSMHMFATEVMPQVQAEIDRNLSHRPGATTAALGSQEAQV